MCNSHKINRPIAILFVAFFVFITIGCVERPDSPLEQTHSAALFVNSESYEIKPGDVILLSAELADTSFGLENARKLPEYDLYWQMIIGQGQLSAETGDSVYFEAPATIADNEITTVISVYPLMDMRYKKDIFIKIKTDEPQLDTALCFRRDILPIFISNCALSGCHDSKTREDGFDLSSYESIIRKDLKPGDPYDSEIYEVLVEDEDDDDRMPPPPMDKLSQEEINLIYRWIKEGAENRLCSNDPPKGCDTTDVTYSQTIVPLMEMNCIGCHSTSKPQGNIRLDSYDQVKKYVDNGLLIGSVRHEVGFAPMPTKDIKLSKCYLRQLEIWIDDGAKNN